MAQIETSVRTRVIVGNCPACGSVLLVVNNGESWPWLACACGWEGDTHALLNYVRCERVLRG